MTYDDAIADVEAGQIAWRDAWPDKTRYIALNGSAIYEYSSLFDEPVPYSPTVDDRAGTDWEHQDKPPRPN
jgi:hypothetical protein